MGAKAFLALGAALVAVIGVAALAAFFVSRDDATVPENSSQRAPGVARAAGTQPRVRAGNVVLLYSDERLTSELRGLAERTAGAPDPTLAAAGQAVLVQRRPNLRVPVTAVTTNRRLEANGPDDPALEGFIEYWLGRAR
jgi:hypothetical protein